ncbi:PKD domain containing protein [Alloalcanivorax dieselolei B5]|uniref:PKD domain containing protein n=1 Tax=Alcanivorax dieselolei (strain DSM 16502 / CGMCC 1.3690 / MCCC 1A00001 / B-5) TaxID=930169 RepID=K0CAV8_ALCDB|nr:PKD domain-containing protein [Alloalcanivorax dieselolei]AFT69655.1 PKD domain containing protein [Alloalcanivorax dieselolei B5]GGK03396.1 hypothetical protein GCM10007426_35490 [Alloalcanivorax dieselolei]
MKPSLLRPGTLVVALLLTACGGGGGGGSDAPARPTANIDVLTPTQATFSLADGPVEVQLDGSNSSSPRSGTLSYQWQLVSQPAESGASLSGAAATTTSFNADLPGDYVASLVVDDGTIQSTPTRVTLVATSPYPVAITAPRHSVRLGTETLGLDGSASQPPTGQSGTLSYQWTLKQVPDGSAGFLTGAGQALATLNLDVAGDYLLQLVVSHDGVASEPADVVVTVSAGNAPPVAVAEDRTVNLGEEVVLDGGNSYDPDGAALQYRWVWSDAEPDGVPIPPLRGRTTDIVRFTPEAAGTYKLDFFVFDGTWKSEEREVTVTVERPEDGSINNPPIGDLEATGYFPSYSYNEQEVGLRANFTFIGYDPEGDPLQITNAELLEKPAGSTAELVDIGAWEPLGKKIQKLDKVGLYRVRMTVSDGVNSITREATMEAKIGNVNGRPATGGVTAQAQSVLVGNALIFDASSSDPNLDPLTFEWELADRPDGSQAVVEAVLEPESQEYRRARVLTDVPGPYTVRVVARDDRGLTGASPAEASGIAKLANNPPEIRRVIWKRNWGSLAPGESFYQLLPCMSLHFSPLVVDANGDKIYTHEEMLSAPEGGDFTSDPGEADCPNTRGAVFTKPGTYVFRYLASDGIEDAAPYDFNVDIEPMENARGVLLKSWSEGDALLHPLPYENIPPYGYGTTLHLRPVLEPRRIVWSIDAVDGDYTVVDVAASHINGGLESLTPWFEGVREGQVIKQGETLNFSTWMPPVPCIRTDDLAEGFHFSFRIKEIPQATFVYENWVEASRGVLSQWTDCEPGQME